MRKFISFLLIIGAIVFMKSVWAADVLETIVAVVGDDVILLSELQKQVNSQMLARNMNMNTPRNVLLKLRDDTLEGMIDDRLLVMKAERDSLEVDERDVDLELKNSLSQLRQRYGSEEAYQKGLEEYGLSEVQIRRMYADAIRNNFLLDQLRMMMSHHISVTPQDMEKWISANSDSLPEIPERFKISHILLYPQVSLERKKAATDTLKSIRERIMNGEDFGELAKEYSQDPGTAKDGGFIDWFTRSSGYDPDFTTAAFSLAKGEISDVIETTHGLHIIKCEDIRGDEIQARHIMIVLMPNDNDNQALIDRLSKMRTNVVENGELFEDVAKKYSEDETSRELGGKINWITSAQGTQESGIPSFIEHARELEKGGVSTPFQSQYGFHIIKLDDYQPTHVLNIVDDRTMIENLIRQQKFIDEYNRLLLELRQQTYIDKRLN